MWTSEKGGEERGGPCEGGAGRLEVQRRSKKFRYVVSSFVRRIKLVEEMDEVVE